MVGSRVVFIVLLIPRCRLIGFLRRSRGLCNRSAFLAGLSRSSGMRCSLSIDSSGLRPRGCFRWKQVAFDIE